MTSSFIPYYGGKAKMAKWIIEQMPSHKIYCEPFMGAANVLLQKQPSKIEAINDLDDGLVNLFRVVRNPVTCQQLQSALDLTPYARSEWRYCNENWRKETNSIEKARQLYVVISQGFAGQLNHGSWSFGGVACGYNVATSFVNSIENITNVSKRLKNVQIESQDAIAVINRWDSEDTLFYIDPPYLPETRNCVGQYNYELDVSQHKELLEVCLNLKGFVLLSGYKSELYSQTLENNGWARLDYNTHTSVNKLSEKNTERIESLWLNPAVQTANAKAKINNLWECGLENVG